MMVLALIFNNYNAYIYMYIQLQNALIRESDDKIL
jgi:hypothetical protein